MSRKRFEFLAFLYLLKMSMSLSLNAEIIEGLVDGEIYSSCLLLQALFILSQVMVRKSGTKLENCAKRENNKALYPESWSMGVKSYEYFQRNCSNCLLFKIFY